ncbi:MAG TPA: sulfurtransferase TusA family protein [Oculatellaceae cyanobacterium]
MNQDTHYNAGEMGCGELVIELRRLFRNLKTGQVICVTATDPGAVEDIPAWCRMTGHKLIEVTPPQFRIQK